MLILIGSFFVANKMSWQGGDILILNIIDDKVEMINISAQRGMVNVYTVENMDVWIPNGMGWYPINRFGLIVKNDVKLVQRTAFYNFGFWPKVVLFDKKWNQNKSLLSILGPIGFVKYHLMSDDWLWRFDKLEINNLSELIPRDLSDSTRLLSDIKINVVNATGKNGFGNMVADRLEWFGLMVTSVQTYEPQKSCQLYYEFSEKNKETAVALLNIFGCEPINRQGSFELVLGTDMEEVIKYSQSYVRSF